MGCGVWVMGYGVCQQQCFHLGWGGEGGEGNHALAQSLQDITSTILHTPPHRAQQGGRPGRVGGGFKGAVRHSSKYIKAVMGFGRYVTLNTLTCKRVLTTSAGWVHQAARAALPAEHVAMPQPGNCPTSFNCRSQHFRVTQPSIAIPSKQMKRPSNDSIAHSMGCPDICSKRIDALIRSHAKPSMVGSVLMHVLANHSTQ